MAKRHASHSCDLECQRPLANHRIVPPEEKAQQGQDSGSVSAGTLSSTDRAAPQLRGDTGSQHCTYVRFGGSRRHLPRSPVGSGMPRQQASSDATEPRPNDWKGRPKIAERHFRPEASPLFEWSGGPVSSVRRVADWTLTRSSRLMCANRGAVRRRFESRQTE